MRQINKFSLNIFVCTIAILFSAGSSVAADFNSTLDLAKKGDPIAIGDIAVMYCQGEGVHKNYQEALKWAEKGVALGNGDAMYAMGYLFQHGGAVKADTKKAYDCYYKAAEQGSAAAMDAIGLMYYDGGMLNVNYDEAAKWFIRASNLGYEPAARNFDGMCTRVITFVYKTTYDEEFDRTLAKNLAKKQHGKNTKSIVSIFDSAGFDISDKTKSNEGYLIISKVKNDSTAEKAGLLVGSDLYQIDNMNTKQFSAQEIRSYISKQQEIGATILVIFMAEDGTPKRADIKLR